MSNIGDGFKNIILAGIGALAYTGERGKEVIDQLVEKGEITLDQGRELNEELRRKADDATKDMRIGALEAAMKAMSPEDREAFAAKAAEFAKAQNADDAKEAEESEAEIEIEVEAESIEDVVEEAAENAAEAVADAAGEVAQAAEEIGESAE